MSTTAPASRKLRRVSPLPAVMLTMLAVVLPSQASPLLAQNAGSLRSQALQPQRPQNPNQQRASQLPATPPTSLPQQPAAGTSPAASSAAATCLTPPCAATSDDGPPKPTRPHHATVIFEAGQLTVNANDSSLHQILRSIAIRTGMTITGGVEEQRVFGTYGPSDPATILATLLDGTGVNLLLKDGPNHVPSELVLTQRTGGPTPAPITAQDEQIGADEPSGVAAPPPAPRTVVSAPVVTSQPTQLPSAQPQGVPQPAAVQQVGTPPEPSTPPSIPQPANNVLGSPNNVTPTASQIPTTNSVPLDAIPTPSTTVQTQQGIVDSPNPPPAGATAPTADSIYQQLLQLQKAKAAAAANPNQTPTPPAPAATPPQ